MCSQNFGARIGIIVRRPIDGSGLCDDSFAHSATATVRTGL